MRRSDWPSEIGRDEPFLCSADSYPPANLSWSWGNLTLCPPKLSKPGLLELFPMHLKHEGVYTCQAQHALGSQYISLNLSPQRSATLSEMMMGTLMGSGVTALLFLSFCIILLAVPWLNPMQMTALSPCLPQLRQPPPPQRKRYIMPPSAFMK